MDANDSPKENFDPSISPFICIKCIGDQVLREQLRIYVRDVTCNYCENDGPGVSISELAKHVSEPLRAALAHGIDARKYSMESDSVLWVPSGDKLELYLQELLEIELDPAEALASALFDQEPYDPKSGAEPFFASDQYYKIDDVTDWEYAETWRGFAEGLKHDERFFGRKALLSLERILGGPSSTNASQLPAKLIGDAASPRRIFRARRAKTSDEAKKFMLAPVEELGAPPLRIATAGRMNSTGISVFYGATSENIAISEIRPAVGSIVVLGVFEPARAIRLLDLRRVGQQSFSGSIFSHDYREQVGRAAFLRRFHRIITAPVQLHDEPLDYLPSQAVAEYVRNVLKFDGVFYASTQLGRISHEDVEIDDSEDEQLDGGNLAIFADASVASSEPWRFSEKLRVRNSFPLTFVKDSSHALRIASVSYVANPIDLKYEDFFGNDDDDVAEDDYQF